MFTLRISQMKETGGSPIWWSLGDAGKGMPHAPRLRGFEWLQVPHRPKYHASMGIHEYRGSSWALNIDFLFSSFHIPLLPMAQVARPFPSRDMLAWASWGACKTQPVSTESICVALFFCSSWNGMPVFYLPVLGGHLPPRIYALCSGELLRCQKMMLSDLPVYIGNFLKDCMSAQLPSQTVLRFHWQSYWLQ